MPSPAYNDGTVQYGSRILTINAIAYVADNISVTRPTKAIDRTSEIGEPSGSVGVKDFETMSATVQIASGSTAEPLIGNTTSAITFDATIGAETFFVTSVARAESKDAEKKFNLTFKKKYN